MTSVLLIETQVYKEFNKKGFPFMGLVGLEPFPKHNSTDNGVLWNATYLSLLSEKERKLETEWFLRNLEDLKIQPGLYNKRTNTNDMNSHDNLIGAVMGLHFLGRKDLIQEIYDHGKNHWWSTLSGNIVLTWNTESPTEFGRRAWLSRIPGVTLTMKAALGHNLWFSPLDVFHTAMGYKINMKEDRGNTSGRCLLYLQSQVLYGKHKWLDSVIDNWRNKMTELYPKGPKEMYGIYFGETHPFTRHAPTRF